MGGANDYAFQSRWLVPGSTVDEIREVLSDPRDLPRWWPSVYREVTLADPGGPDGIGAAFDLFTNGWLPYTLRWRLTVTDQREDGAGFSGHGDLTGTGEWNFEQQGEDVLVVFDWVVRADKPLLRHGSAVFKPAFAANHNWAMRMGERSLLLELDRRRGRDVPPPPTAPRWPLVGGVALALGAAVALSRSNRQH
ncbi:SRPBCC family protein [Allokutzneria oryzae]|uniref:SRPBCC family protein n=1 Tax=Allokutzneria oryzae TaxID=1378989 RepID=A0ABV6A0T9_9PSEU